MKKLLQQKEKEAQREDEYRRKGMMVRPVSVEQRVGTYGESEDNHPPLEKNVTHQINAQQGHTAHQYRQQCTMDGAGHRGGNAHHVPIQLQRHSGAKLG